MKPDTIEINGKRSWLILQKWIKKEIRTQIINYIYKNYYICEWKQKMSHKQLDSAASFDLLLHWTSRYQPAPTSLHTDLHPPASFCLQRPLPCVVTRLSSLFTAEAVSWSCWASGLCRNISGSLARSTGSTMITSVSPSTCYPDQGSIPTNKLPFYPSFTVKTALRSAVERTPLTHSCIHLSAWTDSSRGTLLFHTSWFFWDGCRWHTRFNLVKTLLFLLLPVVTFFFFFCLCQGPTSMKLRGFCRRVACPSRQQMTWMTPPGKQWPPSRNRKLERDWLHSR